MIDTKLLDAYVSELEALRVHGRDLARLYPDIAARLDIGPRRSRDPHVERVVESAAFLAARLRMQVENQSNELPMAVLGMLAPTLLEPVPAMATAGFVGGSEPQRIPRGTRFDLQFGGQALVCMSTTMPLVATPHSVRAAQLGAQGVHADGISIRLSGRPPQTLQLFIGSNAINAARLIDALFEDLAAIQVIRPNDGGSTMLPPNRLRSLGFRPDDAALPVRATAHPAHRLVAEFIAFPEKFRFVSLTGAPFENGTEIRFLFARPLAFDRGLPHDLFSVNRVPVVNLWPTAATPFDINGRQLEYPVRVDAQRYRIVECHSVEQMHLYGPDGGQPTRLDPMLAAGEVLDTAIRWGTRRTVSRAGGEVMVHFQGLDYRDLGQQNFLAAPRVLASNGDLPRRARIGEPLYPVEGLGDWRAVLSSVPTAYHPALVDSQAMRTLISYIQSSMTSLASADQRGSLRHYLRQFPGSDAATWIDAIGRVAVRPLATTRDGVPQSGLRVFVQFDSSRSRTTSRTLAKRVLAELLDSQRSLNRVEDVVVVTT
ncbi:MAG: type VI secretion system baseplate subunit TssF [Gammaproteobacteria bacterium]|nr:type VI secretion system baseplate subunit TssF [Gammaproteobacteria bacterium]